MSTDKKKIIAVVAVLIVAVLAAILWYYMGRKGVEPEITIPLTSEEKRTVLKDLSVPEGDVLPDAEKPKILKNLTAPAMPSMPAAGSPEQISPQVSDQEKLKLLESLKNQ